MNSSDSTQHLQTIVELLTDVKQKLLDLESQQNAISKGKKLPPSIVKLNVGGTKFVTSLQTLQAHPGSYFDIMLSSNWTLNKDATIYIDRDGSVFKHVLDFMRGVPMQHLTMLSPLELAQLKNDADYYQLGPLSTLLYDPPPPSPMQVFSSTHKSPSIELIGHDTARKKDGTDTEHGGVLGETEYESGVHTFKFLVMKAGHWILFGIGCAPLPDLWSFSHPTTYGWAGNSQVYIGGKCNSFKDGFLYNVTTGDTVRLILNCTAHTLSFTNETKESATKIMGIPSSGKWRIHLNLFNAGDEIKLLSIE